MPSPNGQSIHPPVPQPANHEAANANVYIWTRALISKSSMYSVNTAAITRNLPRQPAINGCKSQVGDMCCRSCSRLLGCSRSRKSAGSSLRNYKYLCSVKSVYPRSPPFPLFQSTHHTNSGCMVHSYMAYVSVVLIALHAKLKAYHIQTFTQPYVRLVFAEVTWKGICTTLDLRGIFKFALHKCKCGSILPAMAPVRQTRCSSVRRRYIDVSRTVAMSVLTIAKDKFWGLRNCRSPGRCHQAS